jgi:hypothetical protein
MDISRYHVVACRVLWREFGHFDALSKNSFDLVFLKQGLHETPDLLRKALQEAVDAADERCAAVILGYGLCSSGLEGLRAGKHKIVVPRAHDCITFLLGSKEKYQAYFDNHPGTYWYSPGWIETGTQPGRERYENLLKQYVEKYGEENAEYLMGMEQNWFKAYSNAAYVDLGVGDSAAYKEYTKECARWLKWNCDDIKGDSTLVKNLLEGRWNEKDYLVVNPGETIIATHDEKIIGTKRN